MRFVLLSFFFFSVSALAAGVDLRNDREGQGFYSEAKRIRRLLKNLDGRIISDTFSDVLSKTDERTICAYEINRSLKTKLASLSRKKIDFAAVIYYLRQENKFDDVVAKILIEAHKVDSTVPPQLDEEESLQGRPTDTELKIIDLMTDFEGRYLKKACFDDAYKNLFADIKEVDNSIDSRKLEAILYYAQGQRLISQKLAEKLHQARLNEVEKVRLSLKSYYAKMKSLRMQYPLSSNERSDFVTSKAGKLNLSRRQKLLENYTDLQIIIMGNVIKRLRARLDSPKVEILVYDREHPDAQEVIALDPMERFRFAIKVLRKEMELLKLNSFFSGISPDYLDLMTASYEIGIIPASEVDEIAGLQDIWNPKKTFWDKAGIWIQTFSSVATVAVPPPYGFVPALALVVIQATVGKNDNNKEDPGSLF